VQPAERRVLASGAPVHLGPHAFDLLVALVERSGYPVSKDELLRRVWGNVVVEENTLQVHVSALRKVLGADAIATVSGRGYRFVPEVACIRVASRSDDPIRKHNFPHQLTSFIGREKEIAKIKQLLASTRLLTLTGTGGCGKTRLALQVAGEMLDSYPDGGWLVEFAPLPLGDATLVPQAVANVFAVKEQAGRDLSETVAEWLQSKRLLLVLDNAEHLLGACTQVADLLLRRCDQLAILVISRERLGITGELAIECRRYRYRTRVKMRPARKPWRARPRDCSLIAPGYSGRILPLRPRTPRRWRRPAAAWAASPSPSSSQHRAYARCRWRN
jgi:DNA-binding winged helix-turn-helix (wHTH) protein